MSEALAKNLMDSVSMLGERYPQDRLVYDLSLSLRIWIKDIEERVEKIEGRPNKRSQEEE